MLFGLTAPFAAALMDRFGMRRVVASALVLVATGSGLSVLVTRSWQLILCWGVLIGLGTGSMALAFVATVTGRWFVRHRGLVTGVLTAGSTTGQLVFLPVTAALAESRGWRVAVLVVSAVAVAVVPLVLLLLRERPADVGLTPYGGTASDAVPVAAGSSAFTRSIDVLGRAMQSRGFWLLAGGFCICGLTTVGLVGTHFIPAAHDHGMPATTAAGLLAAVGVLDVVGTVASGWLTDRMDSRLLLGAYYALRGLSLLALPSILGPSPRLSMLVFIAFYGLDWVATVPPTLALCRQLFGADAPVVFGWVFAAHQLGAAIAAAGAGIIRDQLGDYTLAWYLAGSMAVLAAAFSLAVPAARNNAVVQVPA
jgi:predicted MFS family arabinose efflux permease